MRCLQEKHHTSNSKKKIPKKRKTLRTYTLALYELSKIVKAILQKKIEEKICPSLKEVELRNDKLF